MARGAVVLIEGERVALIERVREGKTYYLFPGGTIEAGETPEEAAVREVQEELGLEVRLGPLLAVVEFDESPQYYFDAAIINGVFGTGTGAEYASLPSSQEGSYRPVWVPRDQLTDCDVRPRALAAACSENRLGVGPVLRIQE